MYYNESNHRDQTKYLFEKTNGPSENYKKVVLEKKNRHFRKLSRWLLLLHEINEIMINKLPYTFNFLVKLSKNTLKVILPRFESADFFNKKQRLIL